ncbi:MAG: hypothetical protein WDW38_002267 [Sanguina aurantia]
MQNNNRYVQASVEVNGVQQFFTVDQYQGQGQPQQHGGYTGRAHDGFWGQQLSPTMQGGPQSYASPAPIPMVNKANMATPMSNAASRQRMQQHSQPQQPQVSGKRGNVAAQAQSQQDIDSLYPKRQRQSEGEYINASHQASAARYNQQPTSQGNWPTSRLNGPALINNSYSSHAQAPSMGGVQPLPPQLAIRDVQHLRCMLANIMQEHLEKGAPPVSKTAIPNATAALLLGASKAAAGSTNGLPALALEAAPVDATTPVELEPAGTAAAACTEDTVMAAVTTLGEAAPSSEAVKLEGGASLESDQGTAGVAVDTKPHADAAVAEPSAATGEQPAVSIPAMEDEMAEEGADHIKLPSAEPTSDPLPSPVKVEDVDPIAVGVVELRDAAAAAADANAAPAAETAATATAPADEQMSVPQEEAVPEAAAPELTNGTALATVASDAAAPAAVDRTLTVTAPQAEQHRKNLAANAAKAARRPLSPAVGYAISCVRPDFARRFHRDLDPRQHGFLRLAEFVSSVAGDMVIFNKEKAMMLLPKPGFDYSKLAKGGAGTPAPALGPGDARQQSALALAAPAAATLTIAGAASTGDAKPMEATPAAAAPAAAAAAVAVVAGTEASAKPAPAAAVLIGRVSTAFGSETTSGKLIKIAAKVVRRHVLLYRFQMYRSTCKELGNTLRLSGPGPTGAYTKQDLAPSIVTAAAAATGGSGSGPAAAAAVATQRRIALAAELGPGFCFEMQDLEAVLVKAHPAMSALKAVTGFDLLGLLQNMIETEPGIAFKLVDPLTDPKASVYKPDFLSTTTTAPVSQSAPATAAVESPAGDAAAAAAAAVTALVARVGEKLEGHDSAAAGDEAVAAGGGSGQTDAGKAAGAGSQTVGAAETAADGVQAIAVKVEDCGALAAAVNSSSEAAVAAAAVAVPRMLVQPLLGNVNEVQMVLEAWQFVHTKLQEMQAVPGVKRDALSGSRFSLPAFRDEFKRMFRHALHLADLGFADLVEFMEWPLWRDAVTLLQPEVKGEKGFLVPKCSAYQDLRELLLGQMMELVVSQRESGVFTAGPEHPGLKLPEMEALFRRRAAASPTWPGGLQGPPAGPEAAPIIQPRHQYDLDPHRLGFQSATTLVRTTLMDVARVVSEAQGGRPAPAAAVAAAAPAAAAEGSGTQDG